MSRASKSIGKAIKSIDALIIIIERHAEHPAVSPEYNADGGPDYDGDEAISIAVGFVE